MKASIQLNIEVKDKAEAVRVKKALETMNTHFKANGIIQMETLFLKDPFIRNLVHLKLNES